MRRGTDRHIHTQAVVTSIHCASAMPHAKCNTYKVLTTTQPNLHISTTSSLFNLLAALALHLWLVVILARPPTSSSLRITDRSFRYASPCLWNQLPSSLHQPHLSLCPACSCSYHISSLCQLTTLTIHNSLFLSLPPQDLPLSQIFPTIDSLPASGLHDSTDFTTGPFLLSISVFCF